MNFKKLLNLFLLLPLNLLAQIEPCGQTLLLKDLENRYPGFNQRYDEQYKETVHNAKQIATRKIKISDTINYSDTIYTLPVVFHILYNNIQENINDSLIFNQLEVLNNDFRRLNADTTNTRSFFKSRGGDTKLQFVLASVDPNGNPTNGIVRKSTTQASWGTRNGISNNMKSNVTLGSSPWDPTKYINVWVCDLSYQNQDALYGFAYPPYGHPSWTAQSWVANPEQGVVLHYKVVGRNNPLANNGNLLTSRMGRVAVHEFGHYFGLRHIWADDQFSGNRCFLDDYIDDTPIQGVGSSFACNHNQNTCIDAVNDLPDMVENYMDYSSHDCQNMFTNEQSRTMRNALLVYRSSLINQVKIEEKSRIFDTVIFNEVLIYPRNNTQEIIVEITNDLVLNYVTFELYNSIGQVIQPIQKLTKNETIFRLSKLNSGVLIGVLRNNNGQVIRKVKLFAN